MWFWGAVLGMFVGASMYGWSGAFWGAVFGWLAALLLGKGNKAEETLKSSDAAVKFELMQKAIEDVQARLTKLERRTSPAQSMVQTPVSEESESVPAATVAVTPSIILLPAANAIELPTARVADAEIAKAVEPPALLAIQPAPAMAAQATATARLEALPENSQATTADPTAPTSVPSHRPRPAPLPPPEPQGPGLIERMLEGNLVAKLGVVILFFGVGFLLKYAYDKNMFPPELRLFAVAAASGVMMFIGHRLLSQKPTYALVLIGGAMGLLYLDVYFALKTFNLIDAPAGFALFAMLGLATIGLAVKLDARAVAALGLTGAFMAPILASTGSGNHVLLFSYYLLLNLVILSTSWFKAWRELNLVGFVFTFAVALVWGRTTYQPEHFSTIEPFLIAFFLLYLAIPILFAQRQPPELRGLVDGTLVFGMPMSAAMLQAALTRGMGDYVLAWSALFAAVIYAALAWLLWKREKMRLLADAHLALAVVFGTVAPYFAFQGYPTFAFWTLEGAAIFWMGCRQKSVLARAFALCLQVGAAGYFCWVTRDMIITQPWLNDRVVGAGLIAAATLLTAWFMHRFNKVITETESSMQGVAVTWGGLWLLFGLAIGTLHEWTDDVTRLSALLIISAIFFTLFEWLGARLAWTHIRCAARAHVLLIAAIGFLWAVLLPNSHPLQGYGAFAWPLTFAAYFYVLHRQRIAGLEGDRGWRYTTAWILMMLLATWEAIWRYDHRDYGWVFAIGTAGLVASALRFRLREFAIQQANEAGEGAKPLGWSSLPMGWSLVWWFAGIHGAIGLQAASQHHMALHLVAAALSIVLFEVAGRMLTWTALRRTQILLTVLMGAAALHLAGHGVNPFRDAQFLAWVLTFVIGDFVLNRQERDDVALMPSMQHVLLFALALWLVGYEAAWRAEQAGMSLSWQYAGSGFTIALGIAIATIGVVQHRWPFSAHAEAFRTWTVMPLLVITLIWTLFANSVCDGSAAPWTYVPLLNPLDLAQLAMFAAGVWSMESLKDDTSTEGDFTHLLRLMFAAAAFYWVNAVQLRTVHHWAGVPFELDALLNSRVAQAALSLLWTSTALVMMLAAGRKQSRPLWKLGAALLGVVVLKLFVNDIGTSGTERVVSFIGVGVLLMVIGYVAPVPPKEPKTTHAAHSKTGDGEPGGAAS